MTVRQAGNGRQSIGISQQLIDLDPIVFSSPDPEIRRLIEVGLKGIDKVTRSYGTFANPKLASGRYENDVLMTHHQGGHFGHSGPHPEGIGVPFNVIRIALAVNEAAGEEIFTPTMRAIAFAAAAWHDETQLCGRSLMPEGQAESCGDERLSALNLVQAYAASPGYAVSDERKKYVELLEAAVMATAFNPETKSQNVGYEKYGLAGVGAGGFTQEQQNVFNELPEAEREKLLICELIAAADLLHVVTHSGPMVTIVYMLERMFLCEGQRVIQETISHEELSSLTRERLFTLIQKNKKLRTLFIDTLKNQISFYKNFQFSDNAIRAACGKRISGIFSQRGNNIRLIRRYVEIMERNVSRPPRKVFAAAELRHRQGLVRALPSVANFVLPRGRNPRSVRHRRIDGR